MTEDFLHYIWRYGLFTPLSTKTMRDIEVLDPGEPNRDSGPDFFNARIRTGELILAGNVEIHINASDWIKHGHGSDKAYDSVVLQLVLNNDADVRRTSGEIIPTAELRFDQRLHDNYKQLINNTFWIACEPFIRAVEASVIKNWIEEQSYRRLERKSAIILKMFRNNRNDWQETFYQQLARNFGFRLNGWAFEMLARSLPLKILLRHRDNLCHLEAMLFGQAGFLEAEDGDNYYQTLKNEYHFLQNKYRLKPLEKHLWRFLRLRPANFPSLRIAQFASFIHRTPGFFASAIEKKDMETLSEFFRVSASGYWDNHYIFGKYSEKSVKTTGLFAIRSIIINTVVPFLYFYGNYRKISEIATRGVNFLKEMPPENNSLISRWKSIGITPDSAFSSQGLLQQKSEICSYRKCLFCGIGSHIIKNTSCNGQFPVNG
ncbi:MAG: DUF2851 family protein [bacterium]